MRCPAGLFKTLALAVALFLGTLCLATVRGSGVGLQPAATSSACQELRRQLLCFF